jgi:hypothetical protein
MRSALVLVLLLAALPSAASDFPEFMAGTWRTVVDGRTIEEHWSAEAGGIMLGTGRTIGRSGKASFEFLRIALHEGSLAYIAMPGGRSTTAFPLKSLTSDRAVFENLQHDFPKRLIYWRDGAKLCVRVEGDGATGESNDQWCWDRIPDGE